MTIRVLIADDHELVRAGFSLLVGNEPGMTVVGQAGTGTEAVSLALAHRPDVVLMDIRMPGLDGIEATRRIAAAHEPAAHEPAAQGPAAHEPAAHEPAAHEPAAPGTGGSRILILTTFDLDEYVFGAIRAGASGFLVKDTPPALLLDAIRVIAAGEALLTPSATRRLIKEFTRNPAPLPREERALDGVTDRERHVLLLIAEGLSNAEICERLHISMATAKTHVGHLLAKLGARDRAQLVIAAYQGGLAGGPPPA